jgi:hypothetical protein
LLITPTRESPNGTLSLFDTLVSIFAAAINALLVRFPTRGNSVHFRDGKKRHIVLIKIAAGKVNEFQYLSFSILSPAAATSRIWHTKLEL